MILFSISVHEQPYVIADQVANFLRFNPGAAIVLHFSAWMPEAEVDQAKQLLSPYHHVYCNRTRLWSGYGDGTQMKMHVVNFQYALEQHIPFTYFCLHASNDMFVKSGLDAYITQFDSGYNLAPDYDTSDWIHLRRARADSRLSKMMQRYGLKKILGTQVEGSFYKKEIMNVVVDRILRDGYHEVNNIYAHGSSRRLSALLNGKYMRALQRRLAAGLFYAKEEFYFPTLSQDKVHHRALYNYCYINWQDQLNISPADIDNIRSGNYSGLRFYEQYNVPLDEIRFFAVKRVDRKMDDPIRQYIRQLSS